MKLPILSGIYTDASPEFRTSYPVNMVPVVLDTGINDGYLMPGEGIVEVTTGPGTDRGGIVWNGRHFRVMGTKLVVIDGTVVTTLGEVGTLNRAQFDYSFDYLAVASDGRLFLCDGMTVTQIPDGDIGQVIDVIWIDGFFMTTDGESLVVTELNDPFSVNPLKYGSSEADPDPVVALLKLRNEAIAVNRHTIEFFDNVGGDLFPFQRIEGAQIQKGAVGTDACCVFEQSIAFLGSARNEEVSVYLGANGTTLKIASGEIDAILAEYSDDELAEAVVEGRSDTDRRFLYVHLPDRALVYDATASTEMNVPVWFVLTTATEGFEAYQASGFTLVDGTWYCGHSNKLGRLSRDVATHWGAKVRWEFGTIIVYNEGRGALFHELELCSLTGAVAIGATPYVSTSYSIDGRDWSQDRSISAGTQGQRDKRLVWLQNGMMRNWRAQRFRGDSDIRLTVARLEARLEPLAW